MKGILNNKAVPCLALALAFAGWGSANLFAQDGILKFRFDGVITGLPPGGNTAFAGVQVGDPISGQFSVDIFAPDTNPINPRQGSYRSTNFVFSGSIGSYHIGITSETENSLIVDLGLESNPLNMVVIRGGDGNSPSLTFYDPTGGTISTDSIPTNAALFNAFPSFDYFSFNHGQYIADVTVTQVPEPGSVALLGIGLFLCLRPARSKKNPR